MCVMVVARAAYKGETETDTSFKVVAQVMYAFL